MYIPKEQSYKNGFHIHFHGLCQIYKYTANIYLFSFFFNVCLSVTFKMSTYELNYILRIRKIQAKY